MDRLVSAYDTDGPKVRLGVAWFALAIGATFLGGWALAALFAAAAAVAALQAAAAWRRGGRRPSRLVAGLGAGLMPLGAAAGTALAGAIALGMVAASILAAVVEKAAGRTRQPSLAIAGLTVRCGFFVGLAGSSAVILGRTSTTALAVMIVLVSAFEVGDYLMGTGSANPVVGPVAGIAAVLVLTFGLAVVQFAPFDNDSAWVFGGLVAVLAPLGRFTGSTLLPRADARAQALRRLDSYLLVAPVWAWAMWGYVG